MPVALRNQQDTVRLHPHLRMTASEEIAESPARGGRQACKKPGLGQYESPGTGGRDRDHAPFGVVAAQPVDLARIELLERVLAAYGDLEQANGIRPVWRSRPGGIYLMQDIAGSSHLENNVAHPLGPLVYAISCVHRTPVSLGQGGPGLGTMWGEEMARSMLETAGFGRIVNHKLEHDPFNVYFIASRDERPGR